MSPNHHESNTMLAIPHMVHGPNRVELLAVRIECQVTREQAAKRAWNDMAKPLVMPVVVVGPGQWREKVHA